jgi:hypothetical protein
VVVGLAKVQEKVVLVKSGELGPELAVEDVFS